MVIYTKESLIEALRDIRAKGWIKNARPGNSGGVGNTLEDLLGITENNLPIPNASEWELKCQRKDTNSLTTLLHMEPSPRVMKLVPNMLLPKYGWKHVDPGKTYPEDELSFRQTLNSLSRTDRGFGIVIDHYSRKVLVSFCSNEVDRRHVAWLESVNMRVGLSELNPQPYWGFDDLNYKAGTKLLNCFYVKASVRRSGTIEHYHYSQIMILRKFEFARFLTALEQGKILVDFDARTGHNHGTKFRMRQDCLSDLYEEVISI